MRTGCVIDEGRSSGKGRGPHCSCPIRVASRQTKPQPTDKLYTMTGCTCMYPSVPSFHYLILYTKVGRPLMPFDKADMCDGKDALDKNTDSWRY